MKQITGIHHVTAIAGDPQRNLDFYRGLLGLRLVKLTVNFDDPETYHLYYGDYSGRPGTIITFFPWKGVPKGRTGAGQMTVTAFEVPTGSLDYWKRRLTSGGVDVEGPDPLFADEVLSFRDYDGMRVELVATGEADQANPGIRGLHSAVLAVGRFTATERLLTESMGFRKLGQDANRVRYQASAGGAHSIVDLIDTDLSIRGLQGAGSVHHIAWRVDDDATQLEWREKLTGQGLSVSPVMDRKYFHSIYYREPSGVLFEIATDPPGFTVDEPLETLGQSLVLPAWLEPSRADLVKVLPKLTVAEVQHA